MITKEELETKKKRLIEKRDARDQSPAQILYLQAQIDLLVDLINNLYRKKKRADES